uniref:Uncharacterized protein n=1 Tax=Streptomyces sp. NBC_00049 TaxID=2903617 RepID=A0AAU2K2S0_9ACTN
MSPASAPGARTGRCGAGVRFGPFGDSWQLVAPDPRTFVVSGDDTTR